MVGERRRPLVAAVLIGGALFLAISGLVGIDPPVRVVQGGAGAILAGLGIAALRGALDVRRAIAGALAIGIVVFAIRLSVTELVDDDPGHLVHVAFRGVALLSGAAFIALGPQLGLLVACMTWLATMGVLLAGPMAIDQVLPFELAATSALLILMFRLLAGSVTTAQEQAEQSAEMALHDDLTALPNRRQMMLHLRAAATRAVEGGGPDAVALIDLDHFKQVNDTHGHDVGDEVLRRTAVVAAAALRRGEVLGRWGGEEFLVLLPGADERVAIQTAERIRVALEQDEAGVTASLGVSEVLPGDTVTDVLRRADRALYDAKAMGRNRVVAAGDPRVVRSEP